MLNGAATYSAVSDRVPDRFMQAATPTMARAYSPARQLCALPFPSNVGNLLPSDFPVFGHAVHHPRRRDQDHESVLESYPPSLFRADPARIRRGIDGGDKLLAVIRVCT